MQLWTTLVAHAGRPVQPHDLWWAWNPDPVVLGGLLTASVLYARGSARRTGHRARHDDGVGRPDHGAAQARRGWYFGAALGLVAVALLSPLDALSGSLASGHMVQHVLLAMLAAPLFALARPSPTIFAGLPRSARQALLRARRRVTVARGTTRTRPAVPFRHSAPACWLAHVAAIWVWHAAGPYDAAVEHDLLHATEHGLFLATGVLFWRPIVAQRGTAGSDGVLAVLLVFALGLQSVMLSALLTFARTAWYDSYASTTAAWGLTPLADQQLAGVIMWVPASAVHVAAGLLMALRWARSAGPEPDVSLSAVPDAPPLPIAAAPLRRR